MTYQKNNIVSCHDCPLSSSCLPMSLNHNEITQFQTLIKEQRKVKRHQHLFRIGEPFKQIYMIQTGVLKSYAISLEGDEHISHFHFPAELLGLDGLADGKHHLSAIALEDSTLCLLPFDPLLDLSVSMPSLQHHLLQMISQQMASTFSISLNSDAQTRFAAFLLDLSNRLKEGGDSPYDLKLSMSREEIGNYLGLAAETISRLFHGFEKKGILATNRRMIHVNDLGALRTLSSA